MARSRTSGKRSKKVRSRRLARRRGYRKMIRGWGGVIKGIVADADCSE